MKRATFPSIAGYSGLILILVYLFFFLREVDISLIYYWQQTIPISFGESIQSPGGFSGLLGELFLELLTRPFLGSISVALLVLAVFFSLRVIFRQAKNLPAYYTFLLAALIPFILLFAQYRLPAGLTMSLAMGLLLSAIHSLYSPRKLLALIAYNVVSGIIIYHFAGVAGLSVLFQVIVIQLVLSKKYRELVSVLPLLIVPIFYLPFNLSDTLKNIFLGSFLISEYNDIFPILYVSLFSPFLLLLGLMFMKYVWKRFTLKQSLFLSGTGSILVIVVLFFSSKASINERDRDGYRILQAAFSKDYKEVVELTGKQQNISKLEQFEFNRALYQTGQLLDRLFHYPQPWGEKGIFLEGELSCPNALHISDFNFDLGFANETKHWATEAQMGFMRHPIVLKHLAISYIALGKNDAALKYVRVLSGSRLYKVWCDQVRAMIENNTAMEDGRIQSFIINNPKVDFFCSTQDPTRKILDYYRANQDNKMAFEYLIASYLLQHEVGKVVPYLPKFEQLGYTKLPKAVEEAMLIYVTSPKADKRLVDGYSAGQKTVEDFKDLSRLMSSNAGRDEKMMKAAAYKNTYWYYILFSSPYASSK